MDIIHLWLIHRFKADAVYYIKPTEDNIYQTEKMKSHGIFSDVNKDVGEVIVADTANSRVRRVRPDGVIETVAGAELLVDRVGAERAFGRR